MHPVRLPRTLASALLAALASLPALAATYYVSPSGLDTNAGTSSAAPWQTVAKINGLTTLAPGDTVLFQRGGVWRETLTPPTNGTSAARITFADYGTGNLPVISGATSITSAWTATSGATAGTYQTALAASTVIVVANGSTYLKKGSSATALAANQYFWSAGVLYVNLGGAAPTSGQIEAAQRNNALNAGGRDYITVRNLRLEKTNVSNVLLNSVSTGGWGPTLFFRLENCELRFGNSTSSFAGAGVHADGANDAVLTGNSVDYALGDGMFIYRSLRVETSYNTITNVLDDGGTAGADGIQYTASSATPNACDGFVIIGNTISRPSTTVQKGCIQQEFGDNGIIADNVCDKGKFGIEANGNNVVVERNIVTNTGINSGLRVAQNSAYDNMTFRYNVVYSSATSGLAIGNDVSTNKANTPRTNFKVYNNVFYNTFFGITCDCPFSGEIKNNIAWVNYTNPQARIGISSLAAGGALVSNNNILRDVGNNPLVTYAGASYADLTSWRAATGQDLNSSTADPLFAQPTAVNFHLLPASPARNTGANVGLSADIEGTAVPQGGTPDIGAYEYAGTVPFYPTADAYVQGGTSAALNFGAASTLAVKESTDANIDRNSYLKFDVTTLPAAVTSAVLKLKITSVETGTNTNVEARSVTDDTWTETGVTWNNQPARVALLGTAPVTTSTTDVSLNVTSHVNTELAGDNIVSLALTEPAGANKFIGFYSGEASNADSRPVLVITP